MFISCFKQDGTYAFVSFCSSCRKKMATKRCSACRCFFYCSQACQKGHWKEGHKDDCRIYREDYQHRPPAAPGHARGVRPQPRGGDPLHLGRDGADTPGVRPRGTAGEPEPEPGRAPHADVCRPCARVYHDV
mmetsp:Transcript_45613/g.128805  ORF Transcript_45613/g.128805 Transcript_45613/m.128805 type:complete len:132 (+) Transcript_45613:50-445(+)